MLQPLPISQIKERAAAIGVPLRQLAISAGMAASTAYGGAKGDHETRRSNERKLTEQLIPRELAVLAALVKLHPKEAADQVTVALCPERARQPADDRVSA